MNRSAIRRAHGPWDSAWTPSDVVRVIRARWRTFGLTFLLLVGLSYGAALIWPTRFDSEAKLFVRLGRENLTVDPTASTGQMVSLQESRDMELNSLIEVLNSRALAEQVVDRVGSGPILRGPTGGQGSWSEPWLGRVKHVLQAAGLVDRAEIPEREQATKKLMRMLRVWTPSRSSVIVARLRAKTPESAQSLLQTFLDVYRQEHLRINRTEGSLTFFEQQATAQREMLDRAAAELRAAKNRLGLVSIEGERKLVLDTLTSLDAQEITVLGQRASVERRIAALEATLAEMPEKIVREEVAGYANMATDNMARERYLLQLRELELLTQMKDTHPLLEPLKEQVAKAGAIIAEQPQQRVQTTTSISPNRQAMELTLLQEKASLEGLEAQCERFQAQRDILEQRLRMVNDAEFEISQRERELALRETAFRTTMEKLEQAKIDQALERERISNISVAQAPTLMREPSSPSPLLIVAMGTVAAVVGAVLMVCLAEWCAPQVRSAEDIERRLELPVLLSVPRFAARSVREGAGEG